MKLTTFSNMLHKLRCVEQKMTKNFEEVTGFSITRYEMLIFLKDNGNCLQREIASHLDIDPAAVTRHIKILEKKGYITKNRNEENAREIIISLTDFAKDELAKCRKNSSDGECNVPIPLSQEEINRLYELLDEIDKRLN